MGNFQKGGSRDGGSRGGFGGARGGKPDFKRGGSFGGNREQTMHKATCSDCGNVAEVPFRPTGEKPVFCRDCFGGKKDNGRDGSFGKRNFDDRFESQAPYPGKKSFKDTGDRPARAEYKAAAPAGGAFGEDVKKQLSEMNTKIDRLVSALEKMTGGTVAAKATTKAETVVVKSTPAPKPLPAPVKKTVAKAAPVAATKKVVTKKVVAKKVTPTVKKVVAKKVVKKAAPKAKK